MTKLDKPKLLEFKKSQDFGKKYKSGDILTTPLSNLPEVNQFWYRQDKKQNKIILLLGDHRTEWKEMFGKPHFYFMGEKKSSNYVFEFRRFTFLAHTARGKGSGYEVMVDKDFWKQKDQKEMSQASIDFVLWLGNKLSKTKEGKKKMKEYRKAFKNHLDIA